MASPKRKNKVPIISRFSGKENAKFVSSGRSSQTFSFSKTQKGTKFNLIRKKLIIRRPFKHLEGEPYLNEYLRDKLIKSNKLWYEFYKAGLPVPRYRKIDLRTGKGSRLKNDMDSTPVKITNKEYLTIVEEDVSKGKHLYEIHESYFGKPTFLRRLSAKRDEKLIRNLGRDLAKIHLLGYSPEFIDFFELRKVRNTYERVIIDLDPDNFIKMGGYSKYDAEQDLRKYKEQMSEDVYIIFISEYHARVKQKIN